MAMTPEERERLEGFFDGLHGRDPWGYVIGAQTGAYAEGYQRGRDVWRRPRRKRPKPTVSPNVMEWKL